MFDTNYILTSGGTFMSCNELRHYGIKGMRWGIRRYKNPDGSLTPAGRKRLEKADIKWAKKKTDKITAQAKKASQKELDRYGDELLKLPGALKANGKLSAQTVNAYNRKMAELMSQKTSNIRAPSGRVVSFVAKRGEIESSWRYLTPDMILASIDMECIVLDESHIRKIMQTKLIFRN